MNRRRFDAPLSELTARWALGAAENFAPDHSDERPDFVGALRWIAILDDPAWRF